MSGDNVKEMNPMIAIENCTLEHAEKTWESLSSTLTDGEALDAILTFVGVSGEELNDGQVLERIAEIIDLWRVRKDF
jgi:hypothetical protein